MAKKELSTGAIVGIALGSTLLFAGGTYLIVKAVNKSGSNDSNRKVTPPSTSTGNGGSGNDKSKLEQAGEWVDRGLSIFDWLNQPKAK